jgi:hypothetical protein
LGDFHALLNKQSAHQVDTGSDAETQAAGQRVKVCDDAARMASMVNRGQRKVELDNCGQLEEV